MWSAADIMLSQMGASEDDGEGGENRVGTVVMEGIWSEGGKYEVDGACVICGCFWDGVCVGICADMMVGNRRSAAFKGPMLEEMKVRTWDLAALSSI